MSTLSWLDFSELERRRALQVVELLSRPETRDELGLGTIRDALANAMFPGISSVQQRARYFLFVPWAYRDIERRYPGRTDVLDRSRRHELALIEALLTSEDTEGVIGARARKRLQQLPSTIYWHGLRRWGIRQQDGGREEWARSVMHAASAEANDDDEEVRIDAPWWHTGLPEPPDDWPAIANFTLEPDEADYLRDRIAQQCSGTLLASLATRAEPWEEVPFAWDLEIPETAIPHVEHAHRFSETMHGALLLYNHALAVASEDEELETDYRSQLTDWAARESQADRSRTSLNAFWALLGDLGSRHTPKTRDFVNDWFALTANPAAVLNDPRLVDAIRAREFDVKKTKARLTFDAARETWRGAAGAQQLDFRWSSAQRQLLDILRVGHT